MPVTSTLPSPTEIGSDPEWEALCAQARARVATIERLNADSDQRGRSWSLPITDGVQARIPAWTGRTSWKLQLRTILAAEQGQLVCRRHHVSSAAVQALGAAMASFAETGTGRGVSASRETLASRAELSLAVLKRARRVLRDVGMAIEVLRGRRLDKLERQAAETHHGARQINAASVWVLTSPREVVTAYAQARTPQRRRRRQRRDPLISSPPVGTSSLVRKNSPTRAQAHAGKQIPRTPRPMHLQRTAADLLNHVPALATTPHTGSVCDVLDRAGIDTTRWTGHDIAAELNRDTRERGWVWPSEIRRPLELLRWRLQQLDWTQPSPTEQAKHAADQARARLSVRDERRRQQAQTPTASAEHRQRCRDMFTTLRTQRRTGNTSTERELA